MGRSVRAAWIPVTGTSRDGAEVRAAMVVRVDNTPRDSVPDTDGTATSSPRR
ncbi:hypothetical protein ACFVXC_03130 [Streptomyces sp. NPDC058257]|uniref:hypothetical protein n=1 Tax=Streptomyces sp. NPDC058257 TaxID=3346409 RepID=UPI0036EF3723